ncbi:MAG: hypothetical protein Q7K21_06785, partial [Elusimicrobiota bacterium]|nr:hypothetical protein [Elusimicrobiota bacterium]
MARNKFIILLLIILLSLSGMSLLKNDINLNILQLCQKHTYVGTIDGISNQVKGVKGREGFLLFGQNVSLRKGSYAVKYKINLNNVDLSGEDGKKIGYCDIFIEGDKEPVALKMLTLKKFKRKNPREIVLKFKIKEDNLKTQFRVYQYGGNEISVEALNLNSVIISKMNLKFNDIKLFILSLTVIVILVILFNPSIKIPLKLAKLLFLTILFISVGIGLYKTVNKINILGIYPMFSNIGKFDTKFRINAIDDKEGYLAFGPNFPFKKGNYTIKYKLFLDDLKQDEVLAKAVGYYDVLIEGYPELYSRIALSVDDFKKNNPQEFIYNFYIPDGMSKIQFRVYQYVGNKLSLLKLSLAFNDIKNFIFYNDTTNYFKHFFLYGIILLTSIYIYFMSAIVKFRFLKQIDETKETQKTEFIVISLLALLFCFYNSWIQTLTNNAIIFGWIIVFWFIKIFIEKKGHKVLLPKIFSSSYFVISISIIIFMFSYFTHPAHPSAELGKGWF